MRPDLKKPGSEKILRNSVLGREYHMQSSCGQNKISLLKNSKKLVCLEWSKPGGWKLNKGRPHAGTWGGV